MDVRRTVLFARQLAFTEALVACEGLAMRYRSRRQRARALVAEECARIITEHRDTESRKHGLMGR
jgi:hypothetical protein